MNLALEFFRCILRILPKWSVRLFVESVFPLVWLITKDLNKISLKNLKLVYGDAKDAQEYQQLNKQCFKTIGYAMMDLLYYVDRPDELIKIVDFEFDENLKEALLLGRGVIGVSAHFGNFPLMFVSLVQKGYKVNVIIRNMRDENFSKFVFDMCAKWGINMIQTKPGKRFLKESMGALKRNELLFILLDEVVPRDEGVVVKFLGAEVCRAKGPVLFLERTQSPILPMFIVQDKQKHFKIYIEKPFQVKEGASAQERIEKNIAGLTLIIERYVRQFPLQWGGWYNKRWAQGE